MPATRASLSLEVDQSLRRRSESLETTPQVISENVNQTTTGDFPQIGIRHRRHLSACGTIHQGITTNMDSRLIITFFFLSKIITVSFYTRFLVFFFTFNNFLI